MEAWLKEAYKKIENMPVQAQEIKKEAESNLFFFAKIVNPGYIYGSIHREIFHWLQEYNLYGRGGAQTDNKLVMLPRAHLKSHIVATWCAWMIVRHPEITILYLSATAELAITQLYDIKNILDSDVFRKYWPEFINPEVGKREKWSSTSIILDHPLRKKEGIRDATIKAAGLTTNTTGWHADIVCADDLVVPENAYTEEGRDSVSKKASQFTSIRNAGGFTVACGTRYHPADVYAVWKEQSAENYDDNGNPLGKTLIWDIKEYPVEKDDIFLWPRTIRPDGKAFGFNKNVLSRIRAEYTDRTQFYAQYYNDPNDPDSERMGREVFQYYNQRLLKKQGGNWFYGDKRLNIYAAVDFAYSLSNAADYTAIVVIGMDSDSNIYVLDIDRFKSFKTIEYFNHIVNLHSKWGFKKLQAEVTAAQKVIVESIKDFVKKKGLRLSVIEFRPSRVEGSKEQRIAAALEHRYENYEIWHFEGGWTAILEEELVMSRPAHDDVKDALASAVTIAVAPARSARDTISEFLNPNIQRTRFGGYK
tara:strand:- start:36164 stop:37759 length:1596 start_codon:yes stop_codon:yes gene_type:complete